MYVVKYQNQYCRFGSYSVVTLVPTPQQATLYNRKSDAMRKKNDQTGWYIPVIQPDKPIPSKKFDVFEVTFTFTEVEINE